MKKLIVTTDDYGIIPTINKGIIKAINAGKVNSVAAFSNYDGSKKYKSAIANAKILMDKTNSNVDLGCHFTITSGKPVTGDKAKSLIDDDGYFREFYEFRRDINLKELENEMDEQLMRFKDANLPVTHLSSHHNALTLFPEIYETYLKVCKKHKLATRAALSRPSKKYNLFLKILSLKLLDGDMNRKDRKELRQFQANIERFFFKISKGKIPLTGYFECRHYGPIPLRTIKEKKVDRFIEKKHKTLKRIFSDFKNSPSNSMEMVLHIADDNINNPKKFDIDYPGIEPKYFDSRILEYNSIMNYDFSQHQNIKMVSWKDL